MKAKTKETKLAKEKPEEKKLDELMEQFMIQQKESIGSFFNQMDYFLYSADMGMLMMPTAGMDEDALKVHKRECKRIREKYNMSDD